MRAGWFASIKLGWHGARVIGYPSHLSKAMVRLDLTLQSTAHASAISSAHLVHAMLHTRTGLTANTTIQDGWRYCCDEDWARKTKVCL